MKKNEDEDNLHMIVWSGQDIIAMTKKEYENPDKNEYTVEKMEKVLDSINFSVYDWDIWKKHFSGLISTGRRKIKQFVCSTGFTFFITLCVFINTIFLALDGLVTDDDSVAIMSKFNLVFTIIFTIEFGLKIIALGLVDYVRDAMNNFDAGILVVSYVEIGFGDSGGGGGGMQALRYFFIYLYIYNIYHLDRCE